MIRSLTGRALRGACAAAALSALAACAPKPPPDPIDLASAKTIGVYSFCGVTVRRQSDAWIKGPLDDTSYRKVPEWDLDATLTRAIREGLPPGPEAIDTSIDSARAAIASTLVVRGAPNALWRTAIATADPKADLYVVVFPNESNVFWIGDQGYARRDVNIKTGFGIYTRLADRTAHAACGALVYDVRKHKPVGRFALNALEEVPSELVEPTWDDYTPEQLDKVRDELRKLAAEAGRTAASLIAQHSNLAPASAQK